MLWAKSAHVPRKKLQIPVQNRLQPDTHNWPRILILFSSQVGAGRGSGGGGGWVCDSTNISVTKFKTFYWIDSGQGCGSESEIIQMFWLDPNSNPKKKFGFGYGFGFRHCCRMKIFMKNQKSNTLEKNIMFFNLKIFSLMYRFQNTYESN
jgi:hypothetical protein